MTPSLHPVEEVDVKLKTQTKAAMFLVNSAHLHDCVIGPDDERCTCGRAEAIVAMNRLVLG